MHRREMEAQRRIPVISELEFKNEYVLGWKDAPERFSSILNKDWVRNMYREGMEAQERISIIFGYELNQEYILGYRHAPDMILIHFNNN